MADPDLWMLLRQADQKLADERERHHREIREADLRALELIRESNRIHFAQLNENAARTIEERGHFVAQETFDPFRDQMLEALSHSAGQTAGFDKTFAWLIAVAGIVIGAVGLIVAFGG